MGGDPDHTGGRRLIIPGGWGLNMLTLIMEGGGG